MALREPPRRNHPTLLTPADPQSNRALLYRSQYSKCAGCEYELPLHVLTIDHITPRSRGGQDSVGNLQLMRHTCNAIKGNRDMGYLKQQLRVRGILRAQMPAPASGSLPAQLRPQPFYFGAELFVFGKGVVPLRLGVGGAG